uniref:Uncharacterized protein n=1 Tax=Anguilla anguilla TaxID=7936 RepID=A0A0E9PU45_ANGAN
MLSLYVRVYTLMCICMCIYMCTLQYIYIHVCVYTRCLYIQLPLVVYF